jgi:hypothetical protein
MHCCPGVFISLVRLLKLHSMVAEDAGAISSSFTSFPTSLHQRMYTQLNQAQTVCI